MKFFVVTLISLLLALSALAQDKMPLDEKLSEMFKKNFYEWNVENADRAFYPIASNSWRYNSKKHQSADITGLESIWRLNEKWVTIDIRLIKRDEMRSMLNMFLNRNITPPHKKIEDIAEETYLMQFSERVEIAFVKENMLTIIFLNFPGEKQKGEVYKYKAPQAEIDTALKIARFVAAQIEGEQSSGTLTRLNK